MLNKTHLAIGTFFMLFFISKVVHVWTYIFVFFIATLLPNADRIFSLKGLKIKGPNTQRKRSLLHTFTFCFLLTFLLAWFFPIAAFPFFLGYGTHLIIDSWTVEGIAPFWPLKYKSKGNIRTGGNFEQMIFYTFIVADVVLSYILFI